MLGFFKRPQRLPVINFRDLQQPQLNFNVAVPPLLALNFPPVFPQVNVDHLFVEQPRQGLLWDILAQLNEIPLINIANSPGNRHGNFHEGINGQNNGFVFFGQEPMPADMRMDEPEPQIEDNQAIIP